MVGKGGEEIKGEVNGGEERVSKVDKTKRGCIIMMYPLFRSGGGARTLDLRIMNPTL